MSALAAVLLWTGANAGNWLVIAEPLPNPAVIVSLASHEWERLPMTAQVASAHPAAIVLLTLPNPVSPYNCHDCAHRVDRLERLGVDRHRVQVVPITGHGTYGEAEATLAFWRARPFTTLTVVTSPYHARRALAAFHHVFRGTEVAVGIEPAVSSSPFQPRSWWWHGYDRAYVAYEWAAMLYYGWEYGVRY